MARRVWPSGFAITPTEADESADAALEVSRVIFTTPLCRNSATRSSKVTLRSPATLL